MSVVRGVGLWLALIMAVSAGVASMASATSVGVMAWGDNEHGQLGNGTLTNSDEPISLSEPAEVKAVAGGVHSSLALLDNGTVMAWGDEEYGQLGNGAEGFEPRNSEVPVEVSGLSLSLVTAISAGFGHDLALLANGNVVAWGGDDCTEESDVPFDVKGLSNVVAVSAGYFHSLALLETGKVVAWGCNSFGQLGNGTTTSSAEPVEVSGLSEVTGISGGFWYSLAVLRDGKVMAWGDGGPGGLGDGSTGSSDVPVEVKGLSEKATAISAGSNYGLALLENGLVMAWGYNGFGQLGDDTTTNRDEAVLVRGELSLVAAISAGEGHSLALLKSGKVMAWGDNGAGQLGDGTETGPETCGITACSRTPIAVGKLSEYVAGIAAGGEHSLAYATGPSVTKLEPKTGPPLGGTTVLITGSNFTGVTAVKFGATNASSYLLLSPTLIEAVAPPGGGTRYVFVRTSSGTDPISNESAGAQFRYVSSLAPEFGRCVKVSKGTGKYAEGKCLIGSASGDYEWTPGVAKGHFTLSDGEATLETAGKTKVVCKAGTGAGEYHETKEIASTVIKMTECESSGAKCTSAGASTGEIVTSSLEGTLGWTSFATEAVALDLGPAGGAGPFAEFNCGATAIVVRGSVLVNMGTDKMAKERALKYEVSKGKQKPEEFEGLPPDVLEASLAGGSYEHAYLTVTATQYSEEDVEVNTAA